MPGNLGEGSPGVTGEHAGLEEVRALQQASEGGPLRPGCTWLPFLAGSAVCTAPLRAATQSPASPSVPMKPASQG